MDFALHQPWADAQGYNLSPLRGWLFSVAMSRFTRYANTRSCTIYAVKQTSIDVLHNFKTHASGYQKTMPDVKAQRLIQSLRKIRHLFHEQF